MWLARLLRAGALEPHLCAACGSDFVCPIEWEPVDEDIVWVLLRCGECGVWREGEFTDEVLERFDRRLDEAAVQIARAADRVHADWRSTEADAFAAALDRDLIDAGDFA
jgi:hypothetical protein